MHKLKLSLLLGILMASAFLAGCVNGSGPEGNTGATGARKKKGPNDKVHIGFSMDTLKEERWQRDKQLVEQRAKELGADISVLVANGDDNVQVFFFQAEDGIRDGTVTGVQTCALPISLMPARALGVCIRASSASNSPLR